MTFNVKFNLKSKFHLVCFTVPTVLQSPSFHVFIYLDCFMVLLQFQPSTHILIWAADGIWHLMLLLFVSILEKIDHVIRMKLNLHPVNRDFFYCDSMLYPHPRLDYIGIWETDLDDPLFSANQI